MTSRERFLGILHGERVDRPPLFDEGMRDEVLERWHREGLPPDCDISSLVQFDRRERLPVDLDPRPALDRPIMTANDLDALRARLDPEDPGRLPSDWGARVLEWRERDFVLELFLHRGFFLSMGVHGWDELETTLALVCDDPELVHSAMEIVAEFTLRLANRILNDIHVDFVSFSEPIGGNDRPMLSPRSYRDLVLSTVQPIVAELRNRGIERVVFLTYANTRVLFADAFASGFNGLWAMEVNPQAVDYREIRREFGNDLLLIGGIDLDVLRLDRSAIQREIEERSAPLLSEGHYIPLADGRVRPDIPLENYLYYRELLERMCASSAK